MMILPTLALAVSESRFGYGCFVKQPVEGNIVAVTRKWQHAQASRPAPFPEQSTV
jgi:hypothetical protein